MNRIFISYARKDGSVLAEFLHERLTFCGYDVWKDNHDLGFGENFPGGIASALESSQEFIILISPASINSEWVMNEVNMAMAASLKIMPIVLGGVKNQDIPLMLRTKNYIPMTGIEDWEALDKIVNNLEGENKIQRIYSLSKQSDTKYDGVLLLGKSEAAAENPQMPEEIIKVAQKMWEDFMLRWNKVDDLGLVPPGYAPLASAILARLVGKPNKLPRLFYSHLGPDGKYQISSKVYIDLHEIARSG
jgi:hypothetical protein